MNSSRTWRPTSRVVGIPTTDPVGPDSGNVGRVNLGLWGDLTGSLPPSLKYSSALAYSCISVGWKSARRLHWANRWARTKRCSPSCVSAKRCRRPNSTMRPNWSPTLGHRSHTRYPPLCSPWDSSTSSAASSCCTFHGGDPSFRTFIGGIPMLTSMNMVAQLRRVARLKGRIREIREGTSVGRARRLAAKAEFSPDKRRVVVVPQQELSDRLA